MILDDAAESRIPRETALLPELAALGYKVAHVTKLADDISTGTSLYVLSDVRAGSGTRRCARVRLVPSGRFVPVDDFVKVR